MRFECFETVFQTVIAWEEMVFSATVFAQFGTVLSTELSSDVGFDEVVVWWPILVRVGWFLVGFLVVVVLSRVLIQPALEGVLRRRNQNNPTLQGAIVLYFRVAALLVALLVGAGVAGYGQVISDSALFLSAVALAIGVAAREVIGSLVSGFALVLDPEFNVGDYIQWSDGEGVVEAIALRITRVKTADGGLVTLPNTILTSEAVTRPFGGENYRVSQQIGLSYESDLDEAVSVMDDVASATAGILEDPPPTAYVDEFGDDAVSVRIHYWVATDRNQIATVRSEYRKALKQRLENADLAISPPSQHELSGEFAIEKTNK